MANGHGGYRKPASPAPVSGPGRLSQRTDGGPGEPIRQLSNPTYGEQTAFHDIQAGAQMGQPSPTAPTPAAGGGPPGLVGLNEPTARPDEPVTAGAALGPGVGPEALGLPTDQAAVQAGDMEKLRPYLKTFIDRANAPDSTPSFRNWVRLLRSELSR